MSQRAQAFSGKKKKAQLAAKRASKREQGEEKSNERIHDESRDSASDSGPINTAAVIASRSYSGPDRLQSVFEREPDAVIEQRKKLSQRPYKTLSPESMEVGIEGIYGDGAILPIPTRPPWSYEEAKETVDLRERTSFDQWLHSIYEKYPVDRLSYFEHNLEVWRQLWRVLELSDIILFVVDIRHPILHFPPALYRHVVFDLKRKLVVVFNKIDLVSRDTLDAWTQYFNEQFPGIHLAAFSIYPFSPDQNLSDTTPAALQQRVKRQRRRYYRAMGVGELLSACRDVKLEKENVQVDWEALIAQYGRRGQVEEPLPDSNQASDDESSEDEIPTEHEPTHVEISDHERTPNHLLITIGLIGHPNVGKSALINGLLGKAVVSSSRTPGHTKHFQTIHLTPRVRLCDCPGLVFPSLLPKPLQILSGMYKIAQVRDPYTSVMFAAERVPLVRILGLVHPDQETDDSFEWTAWAICEAFALQRGFLTEKAGRPDVYRAGNMILRMICDGRILLSWKPPGFFSNRYLLQRTQRLAQEALAEAQQRKANKKKNPKQRHNDSSSDEEYIDLQSGRPKTVGGAFALLADEEA